MRARSSRRLSSRTADSLVAAAFVGVETADDILRRGMGHGSGGGRPGAGLAAAAAGQGPISRDQGGGGGDPQPAIPGGHLEGEKQKGRGARGGGEIAPL